MLKIVYPICCGIDVHKTFVIAVIAITNSQGITQYQKRRFSTFTNSLNDLKKWLEAYSCFHVCMESTGKYWIPLYNVLEDEMNICLAHPKYVKAIRGKRQIKKMLSGVPIYTNMIQSQVALFPLLKFDNCVIYSAIT